LTAQKNNIRTFQAPCSPNLVEDFTNFAKFYQRQGERLATVEIIRLAAQGNERDFQILAE